MSSGQIYRFPQLSRDIKSPPSNAGANIRKSHCLVNGQILNLGTKEGDCNYKVMKTMWDLKTNLPQTPIGFYILLYLAEFNFVLSAIPSSFCRQVLDVQDAPLIPLQREQYPQTIHVNPAEIWDVPFD